MSESPLKTDDEIRSMSIKELKAYLSERKVDFSTCLEKTEFVSLALQAPKELPQERTRASEKDTSSTRPTDQSSSLKKVDYYAVLGVCSN